MNDRIKLAEAMGYEFEPYSDGTRCHDGVVATHRMILPDGGGQIYHGDTLADHLPDPFTSADDDYAVLEWMRQNIDAENPLPLNTKVWKFAELINEMITFDYQIGDFARAAIKVLTLDTEDKTDD